MLTELETFHEEFFQEIALGADADGHFKEAVFFEKFCDWIVDVGDLETADHVPWISPKRDARVDGYAGDPRESDGILTLIICDFSQSPALGRLNQGDVNTLFKRLHEFLKGAVSSKFRNSLEESSPAFGLADLIAARWTGLNKVRFMLLSNRELRTRVDSIPAGVFQNVEVTYNVWDIARLHQLAISGKAHEDREVKLVEDFGGAIPALAAHLDNSTYEAFVMVVPGKQLAAIYDRWGPRLLEQNVRSFLQARGSVNKGIRRTIDSDPEMFFAYNNGITATAEEVETEEIDGVLNVTRLKNLQIVNGGQTTASIHAASRSRGTDLSRVFVQMKLSIVKPERAEEVVPKISEYANSQNKVNAADFFANHPFHLEMEKMSRRIPAPSPGGGFTQSKWFYERARGQYADARGRLSESQRRKYDIEYPKDQLITKTDLAKYLSLWPGQPHTVSKGAQKNFAEFARSIGDNWESRKDSYNDAFFKESVAKAIVFRATEKLVTDQAWYTGGYRANIVAYAIAKFAYDMRERGNVLNFETVWKAQVAPVALRDALIVSSAAVHSVIVQPPVSGQNVTEWAKQQACWKRVMDMEVVWPDGIDEILVSKSDADSGSRTSRSDRKMISGIEAQSAALRAGPEFWVKIHEWARVNHRLSPSDVKILELLSTPGKLAQEKQAIRALDFLKELNAAGCTLDLPA